MNYVFIFIGGGLGAVLRSVSTICIKSIVHITFPAGTLFVNIIGALLIGFLFSTFELHAVPDTVRLFFITGFLGGYTTFSTYSLETVQYVMNGNIKNALINILLNNIVCIIFVLLGMYLSRTLIK
ncbi:putative fluoride ion transporter CrcB [Spirochaetia bacterium]|nr:putative fluoride ion transporter CrcB [Spirochaetia bacterium]GHU29712.1 putative fluoride ion transporter CrcB [Spirochaetia bacterium]